MRIKYNVAFLKLKNLLGYCRFRNCTHKHEKQCALRLAAAKVKFLTRRLDSYLRSIDEIAEAQQKLILFNLSPLKRWFWLHIYELYSQ